MSTYLVALAKGITHHPNTFDARTASLAELKKADAARIVALTATRLEQDGTNALRLFDDSREIDGLLLAMQTAGTLKSLVKDKQSLADYPAYSPLIFITGDRLVNH
ncbi:hypothetical protein [Nostoc favosum]|uniref:Uncharacterized protein n=1 Tax=Nostoc favosum CHAB5714 TaxID=2780399 RepID=A0ABS8INP2_9NOSO|nr:hypothetical protein [Nostoc favosum]MCC5604978.1 hypothetical protein [Nostoc favosum CHAB5714]